MTDEVRRPRLKYLDPNYDRAKRSTRHEKRLSKELGGKRLPQSGAKAWSRWDKTTAQGDITTPTLHVEHKRTVKESISVTREWLLKVSAGARRVGKDPALIVTFERKGGKPEDWVVVPLEVMQRLIKLDAG